MTTHYSGTQTEQNALDVYIKLERAAAAVSERINRHLGDHNLTISQFGVLEALYHLDRCTKTNSAAKFSRVAAI